MDIVNLDHSHIEPFGSGFKFLHNGSVSTRLTELLIPRPFTEMTEVLMDLDSVGLQDVASLLQESVTQS